jgi:hypothetical protein
VAHRAKSIHPRLRSALFLVHGLLRLHAERRLPGDLLANHVARGEMAGTELLLDVWRLRIIAWRAARREKDTSAHASPLPMRAVRILTRTWWTHEGHPQLWSRRSGRRRQRGLCLLLEVVDPVEDVLRGTRGTRAHPACSLASSIAARRERETRKVGKHDDARRKDGRESDTCMRTDHPKEVLPTSLTQSEIMSGSR